MTQDPDRLVRIEALLQRFAAGVHRLGQPAGIDAAAHLPVALGTFYLQHDGAELFHETMRLRSAADVERVEERWRVGEIDGDDILVDDDGCVWRLEAETGDLLQEGTRFDRWIEGWLESEGVLYDGDGEFREFVVEDSGERLTPAAELESARLAHKRDRKAAGPWWRLARALQRSNKTDAARAELEQLVKEHPTLGWAWLDLARISEQRGELVEAIDEARAAATANPDYEHVAYFYAYGARIARDAGDEAQRAELAASALQRAPDLARTQRDGATRLLADGDADGARQLLALALALVPADVETLALKKRLDSD